MCHIHVGYKNPSVEKSLELIRLMDVFLGLPSVMIDRDRKRRSLYGKAGCFRLCPYGLEYRVLSAKMYDTDELMSLVWDGIMAAISSYNNGYIVATTRYKDIQNAINSSDKKLAVKILKDFRSYNICTDVNSYLDKVIIL